MGNNAYLEKQVFDELRDRPQVIPSTATPFAATNTTAVAAAATPQAVRAAVSGKKKWITQASGINKTTAEVVILNVQDDADVLYYRLFTTNITDSIATAQNPAGSVIRFDPPIEIPAGKAIEVSCVGDLGDSYLSVAGFEEA